MLTSDTLACKLDADDVMDLFIGPIVYTLSQLTAAFLANPHPWVQRSFAWSGIDVLAVAGVIVALQVSVFAETIFGKACKFKCLTVTSKLNYAGLLPLVVAALLSWALHFVSRRWWTLAPGATVESSSRSRSSSSNAAMSGGGVVNRQSSGMAEGVELLLLPNNGDQSDDNDSVDEGAMEEGGVVHSMRIGYAENRHRGGETGV